MSESRVSVIIPAHDAAGHLERCLRAVQAGVPEGTEFIVVDDASTDDTGKIAESRGARLCRLENNAGPSRARNRGAEKAQGEYLFFVDSDVVVRPGAVERVRDCLDRNPAAAGVFGSYDDEPSEKGVVTRYRNLLHHFVHQNGRADASTFWSGCGAVRREIFREMGGFDEIGYPRCIEDIELGYRLRQAGHGVILDRDLLCTHLKRWTLLSLIRTDVFCRAIPWSRLNMRRGVSPDDLNIKKSQKLSVLLVALCLLALPLSLLDRWFLAAGGAAVLTVLALNGRLFLFFFRWGGLRFLLPCLGLHLLYFFYSGVSFLAVWIAAKLNLNIRDGNSPASP